MATRRNTQRDWPLGAYLKEVRGKMSVREAARRADISESRWRQVELGYQQVTKEVSAPVNPKAETLAAMVRAIGADLTKALELAGLNPDLYPNLVEQAEAEDFNAVDWFKGLPDDERAQVLAELQDVHVDKLVESRKRSAG